MSLATLLVFPNVTAACTGVNAVSIAVHSIRVEFNTPHVHTMKFPRGKLRGPLPDDACAIADVCRVVAYRFGTPCTRNLTR